MDKKIFSFLFSTRLMAVLFIVFAVAMAVGTFIESEYNTETARILIYNAKWFEIIMAFFVINFFGNIGRYQLWKREKWPTLILHLSFIFILVGAFITRYISYEGVMPIREGESSNVMYSDKTYVTVLVDGMHEGQMRRRPFEMSQYFSPVTNNDFTIKGDFSSIPFEVTYDNYIMNAKQVLVEDGNGDLYLKMVESGDGTRQEPQAAGRGARRPLLHPSSRSGGSDRRRRGDPRGIHTGREDRRFRQPQAALSSGDPGGSVEGSRSTGH